MVSEEAQSESASPAKRLAERLESFYKSLPEDEKEIMRRIMRLAAKMDDVKGYAATDSDGSEGNRASVEPHPIDEFRVNLGIYLDPDA
jgi:hypothetical protein